MALKDANAEISTDYLSQEFKTKKLKCESTTLEERVGLCISFFFFFFDYLVYNLFTSNK